MAGDVDNEINATGQVVRNCWFENNESVAGGAATVQWQMREPFSAFALGRLGIAPLQPIVPGLSPLLRGTLIHSAAFHLYESLPGQADIGSWCGEELESRVRTGTRKAFARHERHADRVLHELLELERERVSNLLQELVSVDLERELEVLRREFPHLLADAILQHPETGWIWPRSEETA